jgi:hypothetical protein
VTPLDRAIRKELVGLGVLAALQILGVAVCCVMAIAAAAASWIAFINASALLYGDTDLWPRSQTILMMIGGLAFTFALAALLIWSARAIGCRRKALSPQFKTRPSVLGMLQIAAPTALYAFAVFALLTHSS